MFTRHIATSIAESLRDTPVVFLRGARQVGKTTLARSLAEGQRASWPAAFRTFDDVATLAAARRDPQGFVESLPRPVIIDEVQRAPEVFVSIKLVVDRKREPGSFLLTGSANALVLPRLSDSLAGRMALHTLHPLSQGEIDGARESFLDNILGTSHPAAFDSTYGHDDLLQRIVRGGFPDAIARTDPARAREWFASYMTTVVERDVRDLGGIGDALGIPHLMELIASRMGGLANIAEMSRTLGVASTTLRRHLSLLQIIFLLDSLPAWSANVGKRLVRAGKFYLTDTGLAASLLHVDAQRIAENRPLLGPLLECFVLQELRRQASWGRARPRFSHFRTARGEEVDIVLEEGAALVGVEVKATSSPGDADFRGLRALSDAAGARFRRGVLLYTGSQTVPFGKNLWAIPVGALWSEAQSADVGYSPAS